MKVVDLASLEETKGTGVVHIVVGHGTCSVESLLLRLNLFIYWM